MSSMLLDPVQLSQKASPRGGMPRDVVGKGPRASPEFASSASDKGPEPPPHPPLLLTSQEHRASRASAREC